MLLQKLFSIKRKGNFSADLYAGDNTPESMNTSFGYPSVGGLRVGNTFDAEVHVVLRTHGPTVPGSINEQIGSYGGGSDVFYPEFTAYPNMVGECADFAAEEGSLKVAVYYGNVANVTFTSDFELIHKEFGPITVNDRITLLFVKTKGKWKIVHEHHSPSN